MPFEWDPDKYEANLQKHNIDFNDVAEAFENGLAEFTSHRNNEERFKRFVPLGNQIIAVIYTLRGENIRLISARKARENEKERIGHL